MILRAVSRQSRSLYDTALTSGKLWIEQQQRQQQQRCISHSAALTLFAAPLRGTPRLWEEKCRNNRAFSSTPPSSTVEISPTNHGTKALDRLDDIFRDDAIRSLLRTQSLITPTPIQAHTIPLILADFDVLASASTGSGKTLMFALPILRGILLHRRSSMRNNNQHRDANQPLALILNPTRELAMQTAEILDQFSSLSVGMATGGEDTRKQRQQLSKIDILVGTPGRILQFLDERVLNLKDIRYVVVDEADRMLDLGFEPQLKRIARALRNPNRQTTFCSATFPPEVQRLASEFLKPDYYFVAAGKVGSLHSRISQTLIWVGNDITERRRIILNQIRQFLNSSTRKSQNQIIVFCNTKDECKKLGDLLQKEVFTGSVQVVTGDKSQEQRNKSLAKFRSGEVRILVATDVAARGLDVKTIGLVIQADAPRDVDTFVHRVGRTGRAGASGTAIAMLDGRSLGIASQLVELLQEAQQPIPPWLWGMAHTSRARQLEQEEAIMAGGGGDQFINGSKLIKDTVMMSGNDDQANIYSGQDFRSSAEAGSWGSERDKSYHSFDEEAYSDPGAALFSNVRSQGSNDVGSADNPKFDQGKLNDCDGVRGNESRTDCAEKDESSNGNDFAEVRPGHTGRSDLKHAFQRPTPSDELLALLYNLTGSNEIRETPREDVWLALSRNFDQKLKFEYLGMFPFETVVGLLTSPSRRDSKRIEGLTKVLMVAEKPSIAKAIAEALSGPRGPRQRRGISRALPVYEFTTDDFFPARCEKNTNQPVKSLITVTSVVGHVFTLGFHDENSNGSGNKGHRDPVDYFDIPVVKQEETTTGKLRVVDHLRALSADIEHLVLWLDCDAEGENIAHEVIAVTRKTMAGNAAEEMEASKRRIHRAFFSAITKDALRDAFGNLGTPNASLSRSVDARQELDLRVGVAITRLLTWRCVGMARQKFSHTTKLISYGPCQTPTLSFCVERAREIHAFRPQQFFKIKIVARFENDRTRNRELRWNADDPVENNSKRGKIIEDSATFNQRLADDVLQLGSRPKSFLRIVRVEERRERRDAPLGLNTVALLAAGSKTFGMSPKQVMSVAEKLYSSGFISYPRTETTQYNPNGFDVQKILRDHTSHSEWGRTASHLLGTKYSNNNKRPPVRGKDAGDHPPITCLKPATREVVGGGTAWKVYEFVARTFLGSLSDDLLFTRRVAHLELVTPGLHRNGKPITFDMDQVTVDSLGFAGACSWVLRDIGAQKENDIINSSVIFQENMTMSIVDIQLEKCYTMPPPFLQEHELIEMMDEKSIGTDASMATHVNNIVDRGYVVLCDETGVPLRQFRPPRPGQARVPRQVGRYMVPTPLGISLMELFEKAEGQIIDGKEASNATRLEAEAANYTSVALLTRPAIRAQMEAQMKQIATGMLDKDKCLDHNLRWFRSRYEQLVAFLSKRRHLDRFASSLEPTKDRLRYWKRLNAFEAPVSSSNDLQQHASKKKHRVKMGNKSANKKWHGGKRVQQQKCHRNVHTL